MTAALSWRIVSLCHSRDMIMMKVRPWYPHPLVKPSYGREFFGVYELERRAPDEIARLVT